jgi:hypothetical protein
MALFVYFMVIWYTYFVAIGTFTFVHLVYFSPFGMLHQEKSGNPAPRGRVVKSSSKFLVPKGYGLVITPASKI